MGSPRLAGGGLAGDEEVSVGPGVVGDAEPGGLDGVGVGSCEVGGVDEGTSLGGFVGGAEVGDGDSLGSGGRTSSSMARETAPSAKGRSTNRQR